MSGSVLYEMRTYRVADGRMDAELARGLACILPPAEGGLGLFARYGIPEPVGLWRVLNGPHLPSVIFLYRWASVAARAHAFETFYDDADWQALRASTNGAVEIVDRMDDVLLRGPPIEPLPAGGLYEFARGRAPLGGTTVIGPLAPLCGSDPSDLYVTLHEESGPLLDEGPLESARVLCRRVPLRGPA
jgi:hypothetical protein